MKKPITHWLPATPSNFAFCDDIVKSIERDYKGVSSIERTYSKTAGDFCTVMVDESYLIYCKKHVASVRRLLNNN